MPLPVRRGEPQVSPADFVWEDPHDGISAMRESDSASVWIRTDPAYWAGAVTIRGNRLGYGRSDHTQPPARGARLWRQRTLRGRQPPIAAVGPSLSRTVTGMGIGVADGTPGMRRSHVTWEVHIVSAPEGPKRPGSEHVLAVDIGNSSIHLGVFAGPALRAHWRLKTDTAQAPDDYGVALSVLFQRAGIALTSVAGAVLGSVVPPLLSVFEDVIREYLAVEPLVVRSGTRTGVKLMYDPLFELGSDRIAHAVAVHRLYRTPAIVVDFGTATTFDAIARDGSYVGGAIAPGLMVTADALWQRTAQLRRISLSFPERAISRNTAEAVQSGVMYGHVGLTREMIGRFRSELGPASMVMATGEIAPVMAERVPEIELVDLDLTLQGLRLIRDLNVAQAVA